MSGPKRDRLYELLPAVYRMADERNGRPLQALMRVIEDEMNALESDIAGLYDDWFIETCSDWVIPYIGDLLGIDGMQYITNGWNLRSYVANALAYRRRKGTATVLEKVARDVTGWPAHSLEFFRLTSATQNLHHLRPACLHSPHLSETGHTDSLAGPFCSIPHTVDVRGIDGGNGKYNIWNIGIFLWRLQSYRLEGIDARRIDEGCYTFDPCGLDLPLFHHPIGGGEEKLLMEEQDVAGPLRPSTLRRDIWSIRKAKHQSRLWEGEAGRPAADSLHLSDLYFSSRYFSNPPVISIELHLENLLDLDKRAPKILNVVPENLEICDLSSWESAIQRLGHCPGDELSGEGLRGDELGGRIAVDPQNGRLMIPEKVLSGIKQRCCRIKAVSTSYSYGFSGDIGAGPYDRTAAIEDAMCEEPLYVFDWGEIPGKDDKRLLHFLAERSCIDLSGTAKLEKIDGDKALKVYTKNNSILLKLNDEKTEVILEIDNARIDRLIAMKDDNRLNIYEPGWRAIVAGSGAEVWGIPTFSTLCGALAGWKDYSARMKNRKNVTGPNNVEMRATRVGMIAIMDSRTYREDVTVEVGEGFQLLIVAAALLPSDDYSAGEGRDGALIDWRISARALRPHLQGNMTILGTAAKESENPGALVINGLLIEGDLHIAEGNLGTLLVENSTIVPGKGVISADSGNDGENDGLRLALRQSICGRISLAKSVPQLDATRCIIDAQGHDNLAIYAEGTHATLMESTIIGKSRLSSLTASDCIFTGAAEVRKKQVGCVRFSYLPPGSTTPRRQQCQPDAFLERESERTMQREGGGYDALISQSYRFLNLIYPAFNSLHYPDPAYAQLSESCPVEIKAGAEDGSEMGAFKSLLQPQRLSNLLAALEEYIPIELDAGIFFVT